MRQSAIILSILEKDFPEVREKIGVKLDEFIKKEFTELNIMQAYFDFASKTNQDIADFDWVGETSFRRDFVAFMILTFVPERIHGYTERILIHGLIGQIALLTHVSNQVISQDVKIVCNYFKIYKDFRSRCNEIFNR